MDMGKVAEAVYGKPKPAYVEFETKCEERQHLIELGGGTFWVNVDYAIITPQGSRDRYPKVVAEWFPSLERQVKQGQYPEEWYLGYKKAYAAFVEGKELPVDGTPIRNWPILSPAQMEACIKLRLRSVEDLAAANEETLHRLGMGGRGLKQRANDWLQAQSAGGNGPLVTELNALRESQKVMVERMDGLAKANEALVAQVRILSGQPTGGTVPSVAAATERNDSLVGEAVGQAVDAALADVLTGADE